MISDVKTLTKNAGINSLILKRKRKKVTFSPDNTRISSMFS
jgi:hypothetical protein